MIPKMAFVCGCKHKPVHKNTGKNHYILSQLEVTYVTLHSAKGLIPTSQNVYPYLSLQNLTGLANELRQQLPSYLGTNTYPHEKVTFESMIFPNFPFGEIRFLVPWRAKPTNQAPKHRGGNFCAS